jgi:hypothetical protein
VELLPDRQAKFLSRMGADCCTFPILKSLYLSYTNLSLVIYVLSLKGKKYDRAVSVTWTKVTGSQEMSR